MKKLISLLLAGTITLSGAVCANAAELESNTVSFTINAIEHYTSPSKPLVFSVSVSDTYDDGILLAGFYTDGVLTKTVPLDVSSQTEFANIEFPVTYEDGDNLPLTPDQIKLFTWNKNSLKPLTLSDDVLTQGVISKANQSTVSYILNYLVGANNVNIIENMREEITGQTYNTETEIKPSIRFAKVIELLDAMERCAQIAYDNKDTMLLTCESTKRLLDEEFVALQDLIETVKNNTELKNELVRARDTLTDRQKPVINRLGHFFNIDLDSFI